MKRFVFVLCMFWVVNLLPSSEGIDSLGNSDSPISDVSDPETVKFFEQFQKRTTDLIIIADTSESFSRLKGHSSFPFPWSDRSVYTPMMADCLDGLLSGKIVICSKALLHHLHFMANMWSDLVTLPISDLEEKYQDYAVSGNLNFKHDIAEYKKACMILHKFLLSLGKDDDKNAVFDNYPDPQIHVNNIKTIYTIHELYDRVFDPVSYVCQEINDIFVLLTPKVLLEQTIPVDLVSSMFFENLKLDNNDIWLGLKRSYLPVYIDESAWFTPWVELSNARLGNSAAQLGQYLSHALGRVLIGSYDLLPECKKYQLNILPSMNVFLDGHGTEGSQVVGIEQALFIKILKMLDNYIVVKSLGCTSCFIGGSRFKELWSHGYYQHSKALVSNVGYPIIVIGSFSDTTIGIILSLDNSNSCFKSYFDNLNDDIPNAEKAGDAIAGISFAGDYRKMRLGNYVSIKYPGSEWIDVAEYDKSVLKLSNVMVRTQKKVAVTDSVKVVLMNANSIATTILMEKPISLLTLRACPTFLPMVYMNPNYCISNLEFDSVRVSRSVEDAYSAPFFEEVGMLLEAMFFTHWNDLSDRIYVVIERMKMNTLSEDVGSPVFYNVCLNIKKQEGCFLYGKSKQPYFFYVDREDGRVKYVNTVSKDELLRKSAEIKNNAQNQVQYEKALALKNLYELRRVLKRDKKKLPKIVRDSHRTYDSMSPEAKDKNIARKKIPKSNLNPYAKPFYPQSHRIQ